MSLPNISSRKNKFSRFGMNLKLSPMSMTASELLDVTLTFSLHVPFSQKLLSTESSCSENFSSERNLEFFKFITRF